MSRKVLEVLDSHIKECRCAYSQALEIYGHVKNQDYDELAKWCPDSVCHNFKFEGLCDRDKSGLTTSEMCIECWKQFENSFEEKEGE